MTLADRRPAVVARAQALGKEATVATYRRNEDRFYRYPTARFVVDDEPSLEAALAGLEEAGVDHPRWWC